MANEGQKFASDKFYDPLSETEGINGGRQFEGSDVMFADDVNKIVSNEIFLNNTKADKTHTHEYEDLSGVAKEQHTHQANEVNGVALQGHTHQANEVYGVALENHTHNATDLDFNPAEVGAVAANESITAATKCKITYDEKGLVTAGANLSNTDIPSGLIQGGTGVSVSRNAGTGVYTVSAPKPQLVGYRYARQVVSSGGSNIISYNYSTADLTLNKQKGSVQVLFLRLNQSNTGRTIDIPIEMLILMYHTQQELEVLNTYSDFIRMQVTGCNALRQNATHPFMDLAITAKFSYASRSGAAGTGKWLRAEWWGRELEDTPETSGY